MGFLRDLFSESSNVSCLRVMAFACVILSGVVSILGILRGSDALSLAALVGAILGPAFGGKALQKKYETGE